MKNKHLLNGLLLSLMLTTISAQSQPAWISTIQQYFSKPTQNALIVTTAVAGLSLLTTFACAWNWWKKSKQTPLFDATIKNNIENQNQNADHTKSAANKRKKCKRIRLEESLKKHIAQKDKELQRNTTTIARLKARLASMSALVITASPENTHLSSQAESERVSLDLMRKAILECEQAYQSPLYPLAGQADGIQFTSAGCELPAPLIRTPDESL